MAGRQAGRVWAFRQFLGEPTGPCGHGETNRRRRRGRRALYRETSGTVDVTALARKPCNRRGYPLVAAAIRRLTGMTEPRDTEPGMFEINLPVNRFG
jgi:hypothetical protein